MEFQGMKILVVGSGKSGIAAINLLEQKRASLVLFDGNDTLNPAQIRDKLAKDTKVEIYIGVLPKQIEDSIELVILSPGVPMDLPFVDAFRRRDIPIWGEIELAFAFEKGNVAAITGTNGKTTTTALLGHIAKQHFEKTFTVGNIGIPYTEMVSDTTEDSVTIAEISSFQLETVHAFHPNVSAILNVAPDHLDRHHTMENYIAAKEKIADKQSKEEICVLNYEDTYTRDFGNRVKAKVFYFSSVRELEEGIYLKGEDIYLKWSQEAEKLMNIHEMKLLGTHNVENVMAAIAIAYSLHVPMDSILQSVKEFQSVEHRIEYVTTKKGVDYYNDSKGTNPDAAIKGIRAMEKPTYLIGGGYDKGSEFDEWIESFQGKVVKLVLLGQTKEKIAACAKKHGFTDYVFVKDLEDAVEYCAARAKDGEVVLLSPACASWGMFPNYEVRGQMFKDIVNKV